MDLERIITIRNEAFFDDVIKSIEGEDNFLFKNVYMKLSDSEEVIYLDKPILISGKNLFIFPNNSSLSLSNIIKKIENVDYDIVSLIKYRAIKQRKDLDLAIAFDNETLEEAFEESINLNSERKCNYYPNEEVELTLGYYAKNEPKFTIKENETFPPAYVFEEIFSKNFEGYINLDDKRILLTNDLRLGEVYDACKTKCIDLVIHNFGKKTETQTKKTLKPIDKV